MTRFALALLVLAAVVLWTSPAVANSTGSVSPAAPQVAGAGVMGDVNCSGRVDSIDALQVLRSVAGLPVSADCLAQAADVDCSSQVDSIDGLLILRFVASLPVNAPAGCTPIGEALGGGPTSEELIDQALKSGSLDTETALLYRVYASFDDSRLPAQYKGDDSQAQDSSVMPEVVARFAGLSSENQALLQPFLLPPNAAGSWFQLSSLAAPSIANPADAAVMFLPVETSPHVKVWYQEQHPEDQAIAQAMANDIDSTIWPKLTGLFGEPMSDAGRDDNGGDGRVDIFLLAAGPRSSASPYLCQHSPGIINLRRNASRPVLAHELTHVILFSYRVKTECQWPEYQWLHEATAQWAMDFVYPNANEEYAGRECFLSDPGMPLETTNDCREYDAYIWNFFLRWEYGPELIRDTWVNAFQYDSLGAINKAVSSRGGFQKVWPKFVLDNYNLPPLMLYHDMDSVPFGAKLMDDVNVDLGGAASKTYSMRGDVEHMAALYHRYSFNDPNIKSVIFTQPFSDSSQPTANVQAVYQIVGQDWKVEDWTSFARKQFCFDDPGQKLNQLLIVISNSEYQNRVGVLQSSPQPQLKVSNACRFESHITGTYTGYPGLHDTVTATTDATVLFELSPYQDGDPGETAYVAVSGTVNWTWHYEYGASCSDSASGSYSLYKEPGESSMSYEGYLFMWDDGSPGLRYWGNAMHPWWEPTVPICGHDETSAWGVRFWWTARKEWGLRADADGALRGSHSEQHNGNQFQLHWNWEIYPK